MQRNRVYASTPITPNMSSWYLRHLRGWLIVWTSLLFPRATQRRLRKYLGANGVAVPRTLTTEADGSRSFLVHDPEGNKVGFTQDGSHPPAEPASVSESVSSHIIHAGYVVRNRAALDHFYKDLLGFHLYWQGGNPADRVDWVMMQVPNGTDWIEYMLYLPANPSLAQLGSANHLAPGVISVAQLQEKLEKRGWKPTPARIRRYSVSTERCSWT